MEKEKESRKEAVDGIIRDCHSLTKLLVELAETFVEYSKDQIKKAHNDLKETIDLTERRQNS